MLLWLKASLKLLKLHAPSTSVFYADVCNNFGNFILEQGAAWRM